MSFFFLSLRKPAFFCHPHFPTGRDRQILWGKDSDYLETLREELRCMTFYLKIELSLVLHKEFQSVFMITPAKLLLC